MGPFHIPMQMRCSNASIHLKIRHPEITTETKQTKLLQYINHVSPSVYDPYTGIAFLYLMKLSQVQTLNLYWLD